MQNITTIDEAVKKIEEVFEDLKKHGFICKLLPNNKKNEYTIQVDDKQKAFSEKELINWVNKQLTNAESINTIESFTFPEGCTPEDVFKNLFN